MQHLYNYVIKLSKELNETFETESGFKLYGHDYFNKDRLSNRYATIVNKPAIFDKETIDIGTEILIDPTVYYHSTHGDDDKLQITPNTIDRLKGLYAIEPENIVLYKKNGKWRGYLNNFLGECIEEEKKEEIKNGIITQLSKTKKTNNYKVIYSNDKLKEMSVNENDTLVLKPEHGVSVWQKGKEYKWLRTVDVLAKKIEA